MAKGKRLPYKLDPRPLGQGGYATVHRGIHRETGEEVAVKRPLRGDDHAQDRFRREVELQAQLDHPNVMPILDHDADATWYAMPLAERTLTKAIEVHRNLNPSQLSSVIADAAHGLAYAHRRKLVHRDVNPNNILELHDSGQSRWVVSDWGLVRRPPGESSPRLTRRDRPLGTRGFVAPEALADPHEADAACDVFSLGRVAHFALTNVWPDVGFPLPEPGWLWDEFVNRCTADRKDRVATMRSVLQLLSHVDSRVREMELQAEGLVCPRCEVPMTGARCEVCGRVWD